MLVSRCDYYQYLRCYCLSFPPAHYPHGVQAVTFYPRNKTHLISFLVSPSNFYDFSRKLNKLELQYGYGYGYIVKYEIYQQYLQSGENNCKQNLSWEVDDCKLEKVKGRSLINLTHPAVNEFMNVNIIEIHRVSIKSILAVKEDIG